MPRATPVPPPPLPKVQGVDPGAVRFFAARAVHEMLNNARGLDRMRLAAFLGKSFVGTDGVASRDLYETLGYPLLLEYAHYMARYSRGDVAQRIVEAPVEEAWRQPPTIQEDEDPDTETTFEKAWRELDERTNALHYLEKADLLSGIGRYGVLFLGYDDGADALAKAPTGTRKLNYLAAYAEGSLQIQSWVTDPRDSRYNLPETYQINPSSDMDEGAVQPMRSHSITVHWSRVVHLAERTLEDDVYGQPRLKGVWNRLEDLERVAGGSAEMFWRGAHPGLAFEMDPEYAAVFDDAAVDAQGRTQKQALEDEIKNYVHKLTRFLRLQGMQVKELSPQIPTDPAKYAEVQLMLISAQTRIPKRILVGSERGELASTQDDDAWLRFLGKRRERYLGPRVVRPFVQRLVDHGALPTPERFDVVWPPLQDESDKDQAEVGQKRAEAIAKYASAPGADLVLPLPMFLEIVLGLERKQVKAAVDAVEKAAKEEEEEIRRAEEEAARQAEENGGNGAVPPQNPENEEGARRGVPVQ